MKTATYTCEGGNNLAAHFFGRIQLSLNSLNAELNPICHLLALLGVHHFLHVSRIRVKDCVRKGLIQ